MHVPNLQSAVVARTKILDYLLSPNTPDSRGKCRLFLALGYSRGRWTDLADDLRLHLRRHPVQRTERTEYGLKYVVRGSFRGPAGKTVILVSVWMVLTGQDVPRFVTAHPGGKRRGVRP